MARYTGALYRRFGLLTDSLPNVKQSPGIGKVSPKVIIRAHDYAFRPHALENFPLYFFLSACTATKQFGPDSLQWAVLEKSGVATRQSSAETVMSKTYEDLCLRTGDNQPIYKYAYYVHLRLHDAWRVPVLHGRLPGPPQADATPY